MLLSLLALAQEEATHAGEVSPFAVNFGIFFWTWVVFIALMFLLKKYAYPAILKTTEDRERTIARQLDEAQKANTEAKALLEENRKLLAQARTQAQTLVAEAKSASEKERTAAIEKTRHEQDDLLARARRDIAAERDKAMAELRREAVDLSLAAATKLIGQRLDSSADRALVESYLSSLEPAK
jgi:F-type H+-transporting ATPase subunit b